MKPVRPAALAALALAVSGVAVAQDWRPYSDLRHDYDSIGVAVAHMSSSDINGTLNRISALYQRNATASAAEGDYALGGPDNFERGLESAIADLMADLGEFETSTTLTNADRTALIQTIDLVVFRKAWFLYDGYVGYPFCPPPDFPNPDMNFCSPATNDVIAALDTLARSLLDDMEEISADPSICTAPADFTPANMTRYRSSSFGTSVDQFQALFVLGVESIDD